MQYTKAQYEALLPGVIEHMRLTGEWGEFFPNQISGIPFNRSNAYRYFPLTENEATQKGLLWYGKQSVSPHGALHANELPDTLPLQDTPITAISAQSGRAFRITSEEIKRYRTFGVPLPRLSYDERMDARAQRLGGLALYARQCDKSGAQLHSVYPEGCGFVVWNKESYEREFC